MPQIGTFNRTPDGFFRNMRTLTLDVKLAILPAENSDAENAPDHRVFCDGIEIGAAWNRTGEKPASIFRCHRRSVLRAPNRRQCVPSGSDEDAWTLHWSRPSRRAERT